MTAAGGHKVNVEGVDIFYEKVGHGQKTLILLPGSLGRLQVHALIILFSNIFGENKFIIACNYLIFTEMSSQGPLGPTTRHNWTTWTTRSLP